MRRCAIVLVAAASCVPPSARGSASDSGDARAHGRNVDAARELDQQGVRAFRDGRFADAERYFRASYRLGGPASELWNVARCRERLDDPEGAATAIEEYLAQRDLSPQERAEGEHERDTLQTRPSTLTVTTTPAGATVVLDGTRTLGATPLSAEIRSGPHTLVVKRDGYASETRPLEARFGRAVIVSLDLVAVGR